MKILNLKSTQQKYNKCYEDCTIFYYVYIFGKSCIFLKENN